MYGTLYNSIKSLEFTGQFTTEALLTSFAEGLLPPDLWQQWNLEETDTQTVPSIYKLLKFVQKWSCIARDGPTEATKSRKD